MSEWSEWRPFPDPRADGYLLAPFGPGVYELRHRESDGLVCVGSGKNCAYRMSSLLPAPRGEGTRNNAALRAYVLANLGALDYRTRPFPSGAEASVFEKDHRARGKYLFST